MVAHPRDHTRDLPARIVSEPNRRRVVVGIGGKQPAALQFAVDEARCTGLDLEVVHCAGYVNYETRILNKIHFDNWIEAAQHVLDETCKAVARTFDPQRSHYRMSDHAPFDELRRMGTEAAAAIVVGSDNPSAFARMLGPKVARNLAFTAQCPVVVVPEQAPPLPRAHDVIVCLEGNRSDEHVLRYAFDHAGSRGCDLCVVYALPVDARVGEVGAHHAAIAEALAGWSEKYPDVTVTQRFGDGERSRVRARATLRAELIVIGQPRKDRISFGFDKPLAIALLQHATGPVAIVPDALSWT